MTQSSNKPNKQALKASKQSLAAALESVPAPLRFAQPKRFYSFEAEQRRLYVDGDHWQKSAGWRGPLPEGTPDDVVEEIAKYFTSVNKLLEISDRHLDAVIGLDPKWSWGIDKSSIVISGEKVDTVIADEEKSRVDRLNGLFTRWVDRQSLFMKIRERSDSLLWSSSLILRMYIPSYYLQEDNKLASVDLWNSLRRVHVMVVQPGMGAVVYDECEEPVGSVYRSYGNGYYSGDYNTNTIDRYEQIEYCWVDRSTGLTNLLTYNQKNYEYDHVEMDLDGQLLLFELRSRKPYISPSLVQLNAQIDVALTMAGRNVVQGGFLERVLLNADLPGHYETVPDGLGGFREVFIPDTISTGPNSFLALQGSKIIDPDTQEPTGQRLNPSMQWKDPVSPATFVQSIDMFETQMYAEARQLHAKIIGDAASSGVSRQQALQDFAMSVNPTSRWFVRAFQWMFSTSLQLAKGYSNETLKTDDLRINVQCRLGTKFLTAEDQNAIMAKVDKKLISRETGMLEVGVEDPNAEEAMIESEAKRDLALQQSLQPSPPPPPPAQEVPIMSPAGLPTTPVVPGPGIAKIPPLQPKLKRPNPFLKTKSTS